MNSLNCIGNIGSDAEVRYTTKGRAVTTFTLAIKSGWGDNQKTTWLRCSLWGRDSDPHGLTPFLLKGKQVAVSGEIELDEWQGKDGTKQTTLKCNVRDVTLCGPKHEPKGQGQPVPETYGKGAPDNYEDDIPF